MPATDVPGIADIQTWAQFLGIDVSDAVRKAQMLMQTDPASVRAGGERLGTVAGGLGASQADIGRSGNAALAGGWSGQSADAFGPHRADLVNQVAGTSETATALANELGHVATVFQQSQQTVVTATGATATALRMLSAQA